TFEDKEINAKGLHMLFPYQNLAGFRSEYVKKRKEVDDLEATLKGIRFGSQEWFSAERALLSAVQSLAGWLRTTIFIAAVERLDKEYVTDLKKQGDAASKSRFEIAKHALKKADIPDLLTQKTGDFGHKELKWVGRETQHFRVLGLRDTGDAIMETGVLL